MERYLNILKIFCLEFILLVITGIVFVSPTNAAPLNYLDYQGRLSDQNGNLLTGNYNVVFCIYTTSSPATNCTPETTPGPGAIGTLTGSALNSALWGESQFFSSTNTPDNHVINGVFNAQLGSQSAFPATLFSANADLWLGVNIYNGSSWDGQMSPLQELVSVGYSINSGKLGGFLPSQSPGANNVVVLDGSGNLNIAGNDNQFTSAANAGANFAVLNIGSGGFAGSAGNFSGSSSGTEIGANAPSGFTGNLVDFQTNGLSAFKVGYSGNVTIARGTLTGNRAADPTTAPTLSSSSTGGSLNGNTTYFAKYTYLYSSGETLASSESTTFTIPNNGLSTNTLTVTLPSAVPGNATANIYISNTGTGNEKLQGNIAAGATVFNLTGAFNSSGATPPTYNTAGGNFAFNGTDNTLTGPNAATSNFGRLSIGGGGFSGAAGNFSGSSSGTELAINANSSFTGNLFDFQTLGASSLSMDVYGTLLENGQLTLGSVTNPSVAPTLSSVAGGALAGATYFVKYTWQDDLGQTLTSSEVSLAVSANNLLKVTIPTLPGNVSAAHIYVSTTTGTETDQATITTTTWTEPTSGLIAGAAFDTTNRTGSQLNYNDGSTSALTQYRYGTLYSFVPSAGEFVLQNATSTFTFFPGSTNTILSGGGTSALTISSGAFTVSDNNNQFTSAANAGANFAVLNIGSGGFSGGAGKFAGSANGTELGINAPSGFTGNLVDFQANGTSEFKIDASGNTTINGHIISTGTAPSAAAGTNDGTSPPAPVVTTNSTDSKGNITFGSGTGTITAGAVVTVTFHTAYAATPLGVLVTWANANASALGTAYVTSVSTTGFTIDDTVAVATSKANTNYSVNYIVIQ